jgi:hypothetical protein
MTYHDTPEEIAEALRQEPYNLLSNDCITKSVRFKRMCKSLGIQAKVVVCMGLARACWFGRQLTIPVIHGWGEVAGRRIETSRPLGTQGIWDIVPVDIKPFIAIHF